MKNTELTAAYRETDRDLAKFYTDVQGWNNEVADPFVADDAAVEALETRLTDLRRRVAALAAPDAVYALMKHHFEDFLSTLRFLLDHCRQNPEDAILSYYRMIPKYAWLDAREDEVRCAELTAGFLRIAREMKQHREVLQLRHDEAACGKIAEDMRKTAKATRVEGERLEEHFPTFREEQRARILQAAETYAASLEAAADVLAGLGRECCDREEELADVPETDPADALADTSEMDPADDLTVTVKMDPEVYRVLLRDQHGVDLEELLAWHREEIEKTREDCFRIAAELDLPDTDPTTMAGVNDILFRFEPPCSTGEEMHARCNEYMKRTRALAHRVLRLPEEEQSICVPIPKIYADGYPWGGYEGGDFRKPPYIGRMFLNQYNTKNISDGWIKLNALHESYPGHHCQFVRIATDPLPATVKIGSRLIPLLEGTCLRTETVYGGVFEEDPVFRLFVAYRRHHASVRIYVDLLMFYYGAPLSEAVEVYERELAFDRTTARLQVKAHQMGPGYFTCYYYGMKKLIQWEKEYGWDETEFTELLFSAGYISMESFHMLLEMTKEERERYFTEFPAL